MSSERFASLSLAAAGGRPSKTIRSIHYLS